MITPSTTNDTLVLALDRAPVNALDLPMVEAMERAFADIVRQAPKNGVVLTGAGKAFCAGVDTRVFAAYGADQRRALVLAITRMTANLLSIPCPVVAAVNGYALGGGFVLMLCADYRLATGDAGARFGLLEAQAGVPFPAGSIEIIADQLPPQLLRRWTLASTVLGGEDMLAKGIVDEIRPPADLVRHAATTAARLAAQPAFATVKQQVRGALAARVAALAASGTDAHMAAFL